LLLCIAATASAQIEPQAGPAPDFGAGSVWLEPGGSVPHHIAGYRGHVVLIDFWEYTCINCIRDFAVVKRWYEKYHPYGFDVIAVHDAEFAIGSKVENVRAAAQRFRLPWPVVADQQGTTWKAYGSDGWPNRYVVDPQGTLVMKVLGETNNREIEAKIRELLAAAHPEVMKIELEPEENPFTRQCGVPTQETSLGQAYGRGTIEDSAGHHAGDTANFQPPHTPSDGHVMLSGRWRLEQDGVVSEDHGTSAQTTYHARSLYAVLSLSGAKQARVDLLLDGKALTKEQAGADVQFDAKGSYVEVTDGRMYYLVRSPGFEAHLLALEPEGRGLALHSFTYGNDCQLTDKP
jgi:thiol-disulfide isomerase/thioredoxin